MEKTGPLLPFVSLTLSPNSAALPSWLGLASLRPFLPLLALRGQAALHAGLLGAPPPLIGARKDQQARTSQGDC